MKDEPAKVEYKRHSDSILIHEFWIDSKIDHEL